MRRESYRLVQRSVAEKMGWDPNALSGPEAATINRFFNLRARFGWDAFPWPEWTTVNKRAFRQPWRSTLTVAAEEEVYHRASKKYYCALQGNSQPPATLSGTIWTVNDEFWAESQSSYEGAPIWDEDVPYARGDRVYWPETDEFYQLHAASSIINPPTSGGFWGRLVPFERNIELEQSWEAVDLGTVLHVWDSDVRKVDPGQACEIDFWSQDNGVRVVGEAGVVWVEHRKLSPTWSGATWAATTTYALEDQVWDPASGDFYKSLQAGNTGHAVTEAAWWELIPVPYVLSNYLAQTVYADVMGKTEGQQEKYPSEADEGFAMLQFEFDNIERQQKQNRQLNVRI